MTDITPTDITDFMNSRRDKLTGNSPLIILRSAETDV
jgi:hypothetical protein